MSEVFLHTIHEIALHKKYLKEEEKRSQANVHTSKIIVRTEEDIC